MNYIDTVVCYTENPYIIYLVLDENMNEIEEFDTMEEAKAFASTLGEYEVVESTDDKELEQDIQRIEGKNVKKPIASLNLDELIDYLKMKEKQPRYKQVPNMTIERDESGKYQVYSIQTKEELK